MRNLHPQRLLVGIWWLRSRNQEQSAIGASTRLDAMRLRLTACRRSKRAHTKKKGFWYSPGLARQEPRPCLVPCIAASLRTPMERAAKMKALEEDCYLVTITRFDKALTKACILIRPMPQRAHLDLQYGIRAQKPDMVWFLGPNSPGPSNTLRLKTAPKPM